MNTLNDVNGKRSFEDHLATQNQSSLVQNKVQASSPLHLEDTPMGRLPNEMLFKILSFLSLEDIINFKLVCSHLRSVCHLKFESVGCQAERYSISVEFENPLLNRIIRLGLSHLVTKITLRECPQNNTTIERMLSHFPQLTDLSLHQKLVSKIKRGILRVGNRKVTTTQIISQDYKYNFERNTFLRTVSFVLDHDWPYDRRDTSSKSIYVITPIGIVQLRQSNIRSKKELLLEIDSNKDWVNVTYNISVLWGGTTSTHKETYKFSSL